MHDEIWAGGKGKGKMARRAGKFRSRKMQVKCCKTSGAKKMNRQEGKEREWKRNLEYSDAFVIHSKCKISNTGKSYAQLQNGMDLEEK